MASRPLLSPFEVINNGNMSANITSAVTLIQNLSLLSYTYSWVGSSPVGSIAIQVSNDYEINAAGNVINPGTWNTLTFSLNGMPVTSAPVSGNSGNGAIDITTTAFYAIRTTYTYGSGTGTLQATINGKVC